MKKLLVIDGNSILNRAFYGIRLLTNKNGLYTNAVYGMANIIERQINNNVYLNGVLVKWKHEL